MTENLSPTPPTLPTPPTSHLTINNLTLARRRVFEGANRVRQVLQLQLGQQLPLFLVLDLVWLGQSALAALIAGERAEQWVYLVGALGSVILVGIPALSELVDLERQAGCLEMAFTSASGEGYFLGRVKIVTMVLLVQVGTLMTLVWWLGGYSFSLLSVLGQLVGSTVLAAAVTLFWSVRLRGGGAAWLASAMTLFGLGPWFFYVPLSLRRRLPESFLPSPEALVVDLPALAVVTVAAVLFAMYGRRRLRRAALILD